VTLINVKLILINFPFWPIAETSIFTLLARALAAALRTAHLAYFWLSEASEMFCGGGSVVREV